VRQQPRIMSKPARLSVVIRAKDEAASIGTTLELLASQTVAAETEVIVVDSGSRDATVAIARDAGARIVEMPAARFTFGRSLNLGCAEARAPLVVALSAHAFPRDATWLERMEVAFEDERVACACGYPGGPEGELLTGPRVQDMADALRYPLWGYSNAAGAFRAELWRQRGFREDMPGSEDKEWAWYWLGRGYVTVVDPALEVEHDHFRDPPASLFGRARREAAGHSMFQELPPYTARDLVREWWTDQGGRKSMLRARLSPRRLAQLTGAYVGHREGARRRVA
jgi:rhamnosyltransferase